MSTLHLSARRLVLLLILAAVVALAAGATVYSRPVRYTATTTVFVARVLPSGTEIDSSVADFKTAMRLPEVESAISRQTGVSVSHLHSGLKFARVGASTSVNVSYASTSAAQASNVITTASHSSLQFLAGQQVGAANDRLAGAQKAVNDAATDLAALNKKYGVDDVNGQYTTVQQSLVNLNSQAVTTADPTRLAALEALVAQRTAQLTVLAAALPEWQQLDNRLVKAQATHNDVQASLTDAQSKLAASGSPSILTNVDVVRQGRIVPVLRLAIGSGAVLLILGTALFVALDLLGRRRRPIHRQAAPERSEVTYPAEPRPAAGGPWSPDRSPVTAPVGPDATVHDGTEGAVAAQSAAVQTKS